MADRSRDDFAELHGDRLLGFATIVTLGDAARAEALTAEALARGSERIEQLRHPERAAAWLRAWVRRAAGRPGWGHRRPSDAERRDVLLRMGVDPPTFDALASLDARGRAAVATTIERFSPADAMEIVGGDGHIREARRNYMTAYVAASEARQTEPPPGELANRVRSTAGPVLSGTPK